jgi:hypothetical protein
VALRFGDVLLASLAFSDASGVKKRPVMVVHDLGDDDLLVIPVTSHPPHAAEDIVLPAWAAAGLRLPSTARTAKLATLARSAVVRPLGRLTAEDKCRVRDGLKRFLSEFLQ